MLRAIRTIKLLQNLAVKTLEFDKIIRVFLNAFVHGRALHLAYVMTVERRNNIMHSDLTLFMLGIDERN